MSVLYFDLNQKLEVIALLSEGFSLIKGLLLLSTNLNGCVDIENRLSVILLF